MNSLGISSSYNTSSAASIYNTNQVSYVKSKQEDSDAQDYTDVSYGKDDIKDEAIISDKAQTLLANDKNNQSTDNTAETSQSNSKKDDSTDIAGDKTKKETGKSGKELTPNQEQEIAELKAADTKVRAHEAAHEAAAAGLSASAPSYTYETGPDGVQYAVGGEVNVSFQETGDPKKDIASAEKMQAAALAPADPSPQDRAVAQSAAMLIAKYEQEMAAQKKEESADTENTSTVGTESTKSDETSKSELQTETNTISKTDVSSGGSSVALSSAALS